MSDGAPLSTAQPAADIGDPVLDGDHERMAHIVAKDKLTEALVLGTPVVALCGKVWVPSRDPKRYPVCGTCKEIFEGAGGDTGGVS